MFWYSRFYKCGLCGNRYTSTVSLKHHLDTSDHKYPCPRCQKIFHCERALRRHIGTHNESSNSAVDSVLLEPLKYIEFDSSYGELAPFIPQLAMKF